MSEKLKKYSFEIIAMILWLAGTITVTVFHEPWFDEIQAWQIARYASWHDLLFEVPHDECHPILWHLALRPFAASGLPFEPSIKFVNLLFTAAGCVLILFKTKLPRPFKILLPFTFMIFYQTAIVNRCYSMLFTEFVALGIFRRKRDEKPLPYIITVAFMCFTHLMGIMMGGLLCLVWVFGIIGEYRADKSKGNILKDKRTVPLAGLFVFAVLVMIMIFPKTTNTNFELESYVPSLSSITKSLNIFLALPFEATFEPTLNKSGIAVSVLFFLLINAFMIHYSRNNKCLAEFLVPYLMFSLFYTFIWSWHHMMQIYYYFLIYIFVSFCKNDTSIMKDMISKINNVRLEKATGVVIAALFLIMPASAIASFYKEIKFNYSEGRPLANFIKNNGLEELRIFAEWSTDSPALMQDDDENNIDNDMDKKVDAYKDIDVRRNLYAINMDPYFDHHVIKNNYDPGRDRFYMNFLITTDQDRIDCYEELSKEPYPDIIVGDIKVLDTIFGEDEVNKHHFKRVYRFYYYSTWKFDSLLYGYQTIWMRDDLLEKYGIEEVPADMNTVE